MRHVNVLRRLEVALRDVAYAHLLCAAGRATNAECLVRGLKRRPLCEVCQASAEAQRATAAAAAAATAAAAIVQRCPHAATVVTVIRHAREVQRLVKRLYRQHVAAAAAPQQRADVEYVHAHALRVRAPRSHPDRYTVEPRLVCAQQFARVATFGEGQALPAFSLPVWAWLGAQHQEAAAAAFPCVVEDTTEQRKARRRRRHVGARGGGGWRGPQGKHRAQARARHLRCEGAGPRPRGRRQAWFHSRATAGPDTDTVCQLPHRRQRRRAGRRQPHAVRQGDVHAPAVEQRDGAASSVRDLQLVRQLARTRCTAAAARGGAAGELPGEQRAPPGRHGRADTVAVDRQAEWLTGRLHGRLHRTGLMCRPRHILARDDLGRCEAAEQPCCRSCPQCCCRRRGAAPPLPARHIVVTGGHQRQQHLRHRLSLHVTANFD